MKHKFIFGLQVFTTLILFMAIFVTYLERGEVKPNEGSEKNEMMNSTIGGKQNIGGIINSTFTTSLTGIISCGK